MLVGVVKIALHFPYAHSLKDKRQCVQKLKARLQNKFSIQLAEVDFLDKWQRAGMGFAIVGADAGMLQSFMDSVVRFIEESDIGMVTQCDQDIIPFMEAYQLP